MTRKIINKHSKVNAINLEILKTALDTLEYGGAIHHCHVSINPAALNDDDMRDIAELTANMYADPTLAHKNIVSIINLLSYDGAAVKVDQLQGYLENGDFCTGLRLFLRNSPLEFKYSYRTHIDSRKQDVTRHITRQRIMNCIDAPDLVEMGAFFIEKETIQENMLSACIRWLYSQEMNHNK